MSKQTSFFLFVTAFICLFFGGITHASATTYQLGTVTFPSAMSAMVPVIVRDAPTVTSAQIALGRYDSSSPKKCINEVSSPSLTIPVTTGTDTYTILYTFSNLSYSYCVNIMGPILASLTPVAEDIGNFNINPGISNLNTTPDTSSSCPPDSNNTCYHLLAPLPGIGDSKGNIDVSTGFADYLNKIIRLVIGIITVLAVIMLVVGGITYMTTAIGGEKEAAKQRMTNAIFGLILALGSYTILNTINPNLVKLNITIPQADLTYDAQEHMPVNPTAGGGELTGGGTAPNVGNTDISVYNQFFKATQTTYGFDCVTAKAFMYAESNGNPNAVSSTGAKGLMQLMPATFSKYSSGNIFDPATNIDAGVHYLSNLKQSACNNASSNSVCNANDLKYLAAAYNGGPGANAESKDCPGLTRWQCMWDNKEHTQANTGYKETRNYSEKVVNNLAALNSKGFGCN